jgi:hypothetical protein
MLYPLSYGGGEPMTAIIVLVPGRADGSATVMFKNRLALGVGMLVMVSYT